MTPYMCLEGADCWRTAIACLMDVHPSTVPNFVELGCGSPKQTREEIRRWLGPLGFALAEFGFPYELEEVFQTMEVTNPGTHYMLAGKGKSGIPHVVIAEGCTIIHDPANHNPGICAPSEDGAYWVQFLVRQQPVFNVDGR